MPKFLAETYTPRDAPGTSASAPSDGDLARAAAHAGGPGAPAWFLGAIAVPGEEICFGLYQALSVGAVRAAMTAAGLRPERITPAVSIRPPDPAPSPTAGPTATSAPDPDRTSRRPTQPNQPQDRPGPVRLPTTTHPSIIPSGARPCPQPPDHHSPARTARLPTTWPGPPAYGSPPCAVGRLPARSGRQVPARRSRPEGTPDEPAFLVLDTGVPRMKWARQIIDAMRSSDRPLSASGKEPS